METLEEKVYTVLYNRVAYLLLSIPGVVDYTFSDEGLVVSNGRYVLLLQPDGKKRPLVKAEGVIRLAVL